MHESALNLSIIIPTFKTPMTLESLETCPFDYKLILSKESGLGYARNWGARQAGRGLLLFLDDDLILDKRIWGTIAATKKGVFKMLHIEHCSGRVVSIWSEDFWGISGFDENIKYTGEDIDFYLRACQHGLYYEPIPANLVQHVEHRERWRNKLLNIEMHFEQAKLLIRHGLKYISFWGGIRIYFVRWLKQPRTYFPTFIGFFYFLLKGT